MVLENLEYEIDDSGKYSVLLRDKITRSPIRVATRNSVLNVALWSAFHDVDDDLHVDEAWGPRFR